MNRARFARPARIALSASLASLIGLGAWMWRGTARSRGAISTEAHDSTPQPDAPLVVEFAGCAYVTRARGCALGESRTLHLWIRDTAKDATHDASEAPIAAFDDRGAPLPFLTHAIHGGRAFDVTLPAGAGALRVTSTRGDGHRGTWRLTIDADDGPTWLREARSLRSAGKLDEAEARVAPGLADGATDCDRAWATGLAARIELRRSHIERAAALFADALRLDRAAGLVSSECEDATSLAFALSWRAHDGAGALRVLDEAAPALDAYPEGLTDSLYFRGVVAMSIGDWRTALRWLAAAREAAERLSLRLGAEAARGAYASVLVYLGRWSESITTLQAIDDEFGSESLPCFHATRLLNIAEGRLIAAESGAEGAGDPLPPLEEAIRIQRTTCHDQWEHAMALSNAAQAYVARGDVRRARASLGEARAVAQEPGAYLLACFTEVEGRIALAEKRYTAALQTFAREEQLAEASLFPVERWRGAFGRGRALEAMGSQAAALTAYDAAERAIDEALNGISFDEGRYSFVADRDGSARALIDLLVRMGRPSEALMRARQASARVVSTFARRAQIEALEGDARARWLAAVDEYRREHDALADDAAGDWQRTRAAREKAIAERREREARARAILDAAIGTLARPMDTPPPLPDGTLAIALFPGHRGWLVLAATRERARAFAFDVPLDAAPETLSAAILAPLSSEIGASRAIVVFPHGEARTVDVHALPFDGAPLIASRPVQYGVDVGALRNAEPSSLRAVVLSDPTSDLHAARHEGAVVQAQLTSSAAWSVVALTGNDVTQAAMLRELPGASLVHFAGHGTYAGREGWESAFPLADGARFGIGDILSLPRAPSRVVLSACDGARSSSGAAEGLGLAQAFVVAGSRVVIAPTRPVRDDVAASIAEALYGSIARGSSMVDALRNAQLAVRARDPNADWAAFRALTR